MGSSSVCFDIIQQISFPTIVHRPINLLPCISYNQLWGLVLRTLKTCLLLSCIFQIISRHIFQIRTSTLKLRFLMFHVTWHLPPRAFYALGLLLLHWLLPAQARNSVQAGNLIFSSPGEAFPSGPRPYYSSNRLLWYRWPITSHRLSISLSLSGFLTSSRLSYSALHTPYLASKRTIVYHRITVFFM